MSINVSLNKNGRFLVTATTNGLAGEKATEPSDGSSDPMSVLEMETGHAIQKWEQKVKIEWKYGEQWF